MLPFVPGRNRTSTSPLARSAASKASSKSSSSKASRGIGPFNPGGRDRSSGSVNCAASSSSLPPPTTHAAEKARLVDYDSFTVAKLRELCRGRGLKVSGIKKELVKRLNEDDNNTSAHRSVQSGGWRNSEAKRRFSEEAANPASSYHLMTLRQIYDSNEMYQVYDYSNFSQNAKRILEHYNGERGVGTMQSVQEEPKGGVEKSSNEPAADSRENVTQPEGEVDEPEAWKTRKKWSKAATLLFNLLMDEEALERLNKMTPEELWNSSSLFRRYPLNDFIKYEKKMRKAATEKLDIIREEEKAFKLHCAAFPRNAVNERGELYWDSHTAKKHLEEDVRSGKANKMAPAVLRSTRQEYMEFTKRTFQKHVNQEKSKQRSKPYWVVQRNKRAQQIIDKVAEEEKDEWKAEHRGYEEEEEEEAEEDKRVWIEDCDKD